MKEIADELINSVMGEGNKLDEFLKKGEIDQAATFARSVLMSVESSSVQTDCGEALSQDTRKLVNIGN